MRPPRDLDFWPLTLKSVWESHVTCGTPVQSFVFLGLLVFELEPIDLYATSDRRTDGRTTDADDRLMPPPPLRGRGHNNELSNIDTRRNLNTFKRIFGLSHNSWKQWRLTLTAHLSANNVQAVYQCLHAAAPFFLTEMCYGYCQPALAVVVFVQQHVEIWIIWWCPERERERER